jgi:hypothetical protein
VLIAPTRLDHTGLIGWFAAAELNAGSSLAFGLSGVLEQAISVDISAIEIAHLEREQNKRITCLLLRST